MSVKRDIQSALAKRNFDVDGTGEREKNGKTNETNEDE